MLDKFIKTLAFVVLILSFYLLCPGEVGAASYFVSASGNDSATGTISQPWKTIQKAANTVVAGDTVNIRSGSYSEKIVPKNSGSSGQYITYTAYQGELVIIDGANVAISTSLGVNEGLIDIIGKSYIKVINLTITNSKNHGINIRRNDVGPVNYDSIVLSGLTINNCNHNGIYAAFGSNLTIEGNTIDKVNYSSGIGIW